MSIANGTTYYDYPLVQLTDRPTFADYNSAFSDIDAKLHGLITGAETDHQAITDLQTGLGQTDTLLASVKLTADGAKAKSDTNEENITILNTHLGQTDRTVATKLDSVAIAEPYDPDAGTYAIGDVVVYNGQRYECTTAVAVSEPFDADKWTAVDVETVIDSINTALFKGEVSVTGDGVKTISQLLDGLFASMDTSKIDGRSYIVKSGQYYRLNTVTSDTYTFTEANAAAAEGQIRSLAVKASSSGFYISHCGSAYSFSDASSEVFTNGDIIKLVY